MTSNGKVSWNAIAAGVVLMGCLMGCVAGRALATEIGEPDALASALQVLDGAFRDGSSQLRQVSFEILSQYYCAGARATADCVRLTTQATASPEVTIRLLNLPNAFASGIPESLGRKVTTEAVQDSDQSLQRAGAKLLAEHPRPWAREVLERLVRSSDPIVREHAAASLIALGQKGYAVVLSRDLDGNDPEVALEAAAHMIALKIHGRARARLRLAEILKHPDEVVRANAVYCLSELKHDPWSVRLIEGSLADGSPFVRIAAITSLPEVGLSKRQSLELFNLLTRYWARETIQAIRVDILDTVERMERQGMLSPEVVAPFINPMIQEQEGSVIECLAMGVLSYPDRREYLDRLLVVAQSPQSNPSVRLVALSELGRSRDPALTMPLFELMQHKGGATFGSNAFRVGCAAAIVRLRANRRPVTDSSGSAL